MLDIAPMSMIGVSGVLVGAGLVAAVVLVVVIAVVSIYNRLVRLRVPCKESWSDIDTELQRRHDLIPNLVSTVKGYASHEKDLFEKVTELRNQAVGARDESPDKRAGVENMLQGSVGKLIATAEAYPDLKANQNMLSLQEELASTENRIGFSRQAYNDAVMKMNNGIEQFPSNIVAGMFSFKQGEFWEIEKPEERENVKVSF